MEIDFGMKLMIKIKPFISVTARIQSSSQGRIRPERILNSWDQSFAADPCDIWASDQHCPRLCRRTGSIAADSDILTNFDDFSEVLLAKTLAKEDDFDWDDWSA